MTDDHTNIQKIIRQHAHDVRNSINNLDLQTVLLEDLGTDPEVAETLKGMRAEFTQLEVTVKALQSKFAEPQPGTPTADDLTQFKDPQTTPMGGCAEVEARGTRPPAQPRDAADPSSITAPETVLIIDDQARNLELIGAVLTMAGYEVICASSGEDAFALLAANTPDLILLDMLMPRMNGIEVCSKLKAKACWADIPTIFLSAADDKNLIVEALECGGVDYVTKPFNKAELLSRVRTHLALKRTREELRDLAEDKDELLGLLTHDLGNDLTGLYVSAVALERQLDTIPALCAPLVVNIVRSTEAVTAFVQEFLTNQSAERIKVLAEPLDICIILEEAEERHTLVAEAKRITLFVELPEHPLYAHADREGLPRVLDNLLSNAIKFSSAGSCVTLTAGVGPLEWIHFSVSDEGPGFTAEDREKMFRRYGRLSARPTAGEHSTGLGLSIVKQLVESMKGRIIVESKAGEGACITVTLPAALTAGEISPGNGPILNPSVVE
ncbi:MAG: hybrid sensor histidine kinase/response regulator [Verrucomicrobiota bacterium]|nr:hybrid sensor histidine kinase/response regulator [Verrucomicrobiota bacterium]